MGFIINAATGDVLEPGTNRVLAPRVLPRELYDALIRNRVDLSENFDALPRWVYPLIHAYNDLKES